MNERIKLLRKTLKLSQDEFGDKIGISGGAISLLEKGKRSITEQNVKAICNVFSVSESWLRTGEGDMFLQMDPEDELMEWAGRVLSAHPQDFRKRFVKMLMGLTDDQWHIMEAKILELAAQYDDEDKKEED